MKADELLKEIEKLPLHKRMYLVEKTLHTIRKKEDLDQMNLAAEALYSDYKKDKDLTAFTDIDFEDFYETR
ncbi:hypothetical protein [Mariniphaga sp.]|uniref:hypothetical protein n=1 Tax=Mariniphaga sp. TaxID=1954475 RepID=UPI003561E778